MFQVQVPDPHLSEVQDSYLTIQMSRIYGKNRHWLYRSKFIKFNSKPTQLTGVFAIAFMTEFCFSGWNGKNSVHFDTNVMRNHLLKCMEDKQFSPFPKIKPVKSKFTLNLKNTSVNLSIKRNARPSVICRIYLKTWFLVISVPLGIILAVL